MIPLRYFSGNLAYDFKVPVHGSQRGNDLIVRFTLPARPPGDGYIWVSLPFSQGLEIKPQAGLDYEVVVPQIALHHFLGTRFSFALEDNSLGARPAEEEITVDNIPSLTSPTSVLIDNGFVIRGSNFAPNTMFYFSDQQGVTYPLGAYIVNQKTALVPVRGIPGGGPTPRITAMTFGSRSEFTTSLASSDGFSRIHGAFGWPVGLLSPLGIHSLFISRDLYSGPSVAGQLVAGVLPQELGGCRLTVGGLSAALLFVSPRQFNFQVPASVTPGLSEVLAQCGSNVSRGPVLVASEAVSIYPKVFNSDFTENSASNPANGVAIVYGTGCGAGSLPSITGQPIPLGQVATPLSEVVVGTSIPDVTGTVEFAGYLPGFVGLAQFNLSFRSLPPLLPNFQWRFGFALGCGNSASASLVVTVQVPP